MGGGIRIAFNPGAFKSVYIGPGKALMKVARRSFKRSKCTFFVEYPELIMALKHFIDTQDVARQIALLPNPDYNPFRDYKKIEARELKALGVKELMKF